MSIADRELVTRRMARVNKALADWRGRWVRINKDGTVTHNGSLCRKCNGGAF